MLTLAHISDLHLSPRTRPAVAELAGKRLLGVAAWHLKRRKLHRRAILRAIVADIRAAGPDHIALTGDLIQWSSAGEFVHARRWLERLGGADHVTVVPGNHDSYVRVPWTRGLSHWADYMRGDLRLSGSVGVNGHALPFPFVRQRRNVALIGLSSASPASFRTASGSLGAQQLEALAETLATLHGRGFYRILLIHHPPLVKQAAPRKSLLDAAQLEGVLEAEGAELVLHGHLHRHMREELHSATGPVHIIGIPSASQRAYAGFPRAAWYSYAIRRQGGRWHTDAVVRSFEEGSETMVTENRFSLGHD